MGKEAYRTVPGERRRSTTYISCLLYVLTQPPAASENIKHHELVMNSHRCRIRARISIRRLNLEWVLYLDSSLLNFIDFLS